MTYRYPPHLIRRRDVCRCLVCDMVHGSISRNRMAAFVKRHRRCGYKRGL